MPTGLPMHRIENTPVVNSKTENTISRILMILTESPFLNDSRPAALAARCFSFCL